LKEEEYYTTRTQAIKLSPLRTEGLILDIGGGGEGVIGKLNGRQVVAIDTRAEELKETRNQASKIVMDAADLKFLPESFDVCTSFFSFMYIDYDKHLRVFSEAHRVLKDKGRFLVWDAKMPAEHEGYTVFVVDLKIRLPNEKIKTKYGVKWDKQQDLEHFKELAQRTSFKIMNEWSRGEVFFLEMIKMYKDTTHNSNRRVLT
jgi:ubiquinone/menaquinone biosynthesis C-methylase UbiE